MNIHLSEILVVLMVALLVIKPQQLPDIALKLGRLTKWARQNFLKLKREFESHD